MLDHYLWKTKYYVPYQYSFIPLTYNNGMLRVTISTLYFSSTIPILYFYEEFKSEKKGGKEKGWNVK